MTPFIGMKLKDKVNGYILTVTKVGPHFATVTHENGVFYFTKIALMSENFDEITGIPEHKRKNLNAETIAHRQS